MNLSYLVTIHNETDTLRNLLERLTKYCEAGDEIVILDDFSDDETTKRILSRYTHMDNVRLYQHALAKDYGAHKNYGIEQCKGEWIFQIDGDELPSETLVSNLKTIIESNPTIETYVVPRINAWKGLTAEHAKQWGWSLDMSPTYNRLRAAWPDYQFRVFKNTPTIRFQKRLHERVEGFNEYACFPADNEELTLYHDKTIETQIKTNLRYNEWFTAEENAGVSNKRS